MPWSRFKNTHESTPVARADARRTRGPQWTVSSLVVDTHWPPLEFLWNLTQELLVTERVHRVPGGRRASGKDSGENSDRGQEDRGAEEGHRIDGPEAEEE